MKIILRTMTLIIVAIIVIGAVLISNMWAPKNPEQAIPEPSQAVTRATWSNDDIKPLRTSNIDLGGDDNNGMSDTYEVPLMVNGEEVGYIEGIGILVTISGAQIYLPDDAQSAHYDAETNNLVSSSNQQLNAYIDSMALNATLKFGSKNLTSVKLDDEVFMCTVKDPSGKFKNGQVTTIYASRVRVDLTWWQKLNFTDPTKFGVDYNWAYKSLAGMEIPLDWFVDHKDSVWYKVARNYYVATLYTPMLVVVSLFGGGMEPVSQVKMWGHTTLASLQKQLYGRVTVPWGVVKNALTDIGAETIFINTENYQLQSFFAGPLCDMRTGEPIILFCQKHKQSCIRNSCTDAEIIAIPSGRKLQVVNNRLEDSVSYNYLMQNPLKNQVGKDMYLHSMEYEGKRYMRVVWHDGKGWTDIDGNRIDDELDQDIVKWNTNPKGQGIDAIWNLAKKTVKDFWEKMPWVKNDKSMSIWDWIKLFIVIAAGIIILAIPLLVIVFIVKRVRR